MATSLICTKGVLTLRGDVPTETFLLSEIAFVGYQLPRVDFVIMDFVVCDFYFTDVATLYFGLLRLSVCSPA